MLTIIFVGLCFFRTPSMSLKSPRKGVPAGRSASCAVTTPMSGSRSQPEYLPRDRIETNQQKALPRALAFHVRARPKRQQRGCKKSAGENQKWCAARDVEGIGEHGVQQQIDSGTETKLLDEADPPCGWLRAASLLQLNGCPRMPTPMHRIRGSFLRRSDPRGNTRRKREERLRNLWISAEGR